MEIFSVFLAILLTALCYQVAWVINSYFARKILFKWIAANHYSLLKAELRMFWRGPFFWTSSKYDKVFKFQVRQRNGKRINGWICFRAKALFPGNQLSKYNVTVHWDSNNGDRPESH
jgi:hypothetical protein